MNKLGRAVKVDGGYKLYKKEENDKTFYELHFVYKNDSVFLSYVPNAEEFEVYVDFHKEEMAIMMEEARKEFATN